jgi:hypothetical protein
VFYVLINSAFVGERILNSVIFSDFDKVWNKCREILVQRHITAFLGYQLTDVRRHICELADGGQMQRS